MKNEQTGSNQAEQRFAGHGSARGIGIGTAWIADRARLPTPEFYLPEERIEDEILRLGEAIAQSIRQVKRLKEKAGAVDPGTAAGEELGYLLDAHLQMLSGSRLLRGVEARIRMARINAEAAVRDEVGAITESFRRMNDAYLAARATDIREVGNRLIRNLMHAPFQALQHVPPGSVIVAEDLAPGDAMMLDPATVAGIACALGGAESHTAIIARSLGIPAVLGIAGLAQMIDPGDTVVVDGTIGQVIIHPTLETTRGAIERQRALADEHRRLTALRDLPAMTRDGTEVALRANLERPQDVVTATGFGAAGVGLLRTEFFYLGRDDLPSEEEHYRWLRATVEALGGETVTIRTLDIGGDKLPATMGAALAGAPNPALGLRGVRLSLAQPKLFETQLVAILRAARHGPVRILLPMVACAEEVRAARQMLRRVAQRLRRRGEAVPDPLPPLGVMVEVPGAALSADALALEADFFAIGTNDLTQYTLAIDRGDERVATLYNPLHPAVLRLIQFTLEAGKRAGRPVSVCGEMAGDPKYTALLLGLGVREFSMAPTNLLRVKRRLRQLDVADCAAWAHHVMSEWDGGRIQRLVEAHDALFTEDAA